MYQRGDVVIVKFPFTNLKKFKQRPALVISNNSVNKSRDYILIQITSKFKDDEFTFKLEEKQFKNNQPLPLTSYLKLNKLFTINEELISKKHSAIIDSTISEITSKLINLIS